jgi:hypothetical protein
MLFKLRKRIEKRFGITGDKGHSISWIETLLQTPLDDYRKNAIGLKNYESASTSLRDWLKKCSRLRSLDPNFDYRVKYCLNSAVRKLQLPIRFSTLERKNKELHNLLSDKMQELSNDF